LSLTINSVLCLLSFCINLYCSDIYSASYCERNFTKALSVDHLQNAVDRSLHGAYSIHPCHLLNLHCVKSFPPSLCNHELNVAVACPLRQSGYRVQSQLLLSCLVLPLAICNGSTLHVYTLPLPPYCLFSKHRRARLHLETATVFVSRMFDWRPALHPIPVKPILLNEMRELRDNSINRLSDTHVKSDGARQWGFPIN